MPTPEECAQFSQRITDIHEEAVSRDRSVHTHLRKLSKDFQDHLEIEEGRHAENIKSRALNTKAIETLTINTNGMVTAWTTIANLAKFVVVSATLFGAIAGIHVTLQYFNMFS